MKLAYILGTYGVISETFIQDLASGLNAAGDELTIICDSINPDGPAVPGTTALVGFGKSLMQRLRWPRIALRAIGPRGDRLNEHLCHRVASGRLSSALSQLRPEAAYVDYGFNAIHALPGLRAGRIPFVVHFHGIDASAMLHEGYYQEAILPVFHAAYRVIVPSQHLRRRLVVAGCPPEKIRIIPYAPDLKRFSPGDWEARRRLPPTVLSVGRLVEKKCPQAVIRAFALVHGAVPEARLVMIGDGPLMPSCRKLVADMGLAEVVELRGRQPVDQVAAAMQDAWAFAQHSVTAGNGDQEGLPVAILEACARALPVVATLHSGIPEEVVDGETGFLVQEYDFEGMAERLIRLLRDSDLAERLGRAGRSHLEARSHPEQRLITVRQLIHAAAGGAA